MEAAGTERSARWGDGGNPRLDLVPAEANPGHVGTIGLGDNRMIP